MTNEIKTTENPLIKEAISNLGSQTLLAKAIDVKQPTIHRMLKGMTTISAEHAIKIEKVTNGQVKKEHLRPDIFGELNTEANHAH